MAGLPAGTCAAVLAARAPDGREALRAAGSCPLCHSRLPLTQLLPVASWPRRRGICGSCGGSLGARMTAAELLAAGAFAILGLRFGFNLVLVPLCYLSVIGLALALVDLDHHRLPHVLTLPSYLVVAGLLTITAAFTPDGWRDLVASLAGMVILWLFYAGLAYWLPGQLGWGDVWLAGLLGLSLGWFGARTIVAGAIAGWIIALPVALWRIAKRQGNEKPPAIALGPFMLSGAFLAILAS